MAEHGELIVNPNREDAKGNEIDILDLVDTETLQRVQDSFADLVGVAALTIRKNGEPVTNPSNFTDFCMKYTRSTEVGCERCEYCDSYGGQIAQESGYSVSYYCHAGLVDFAAPIMAGDEIVGSFIGGQVLTDAPDEEKTRQIAEELGVDPDIYWEEIQKVTIIKEEDLKKATDFLFTIAGIISDMAYTKYLLVDAAKELKASAKMKADFLANMSHEIRTPMNAVIGMAEMALREKISPAAKEYLMQIKSSGRSLLAIINDILDFSKIESGKMDIVPVEYETLSVFHDVSNMVMTRLADKNVELILDISPNIPLTMFGDDNRIKQIVLNLANNAVKFTNEGQVRIRVEAVKMPQNMMELQIAIEDTGIGIKPEEIEKIFDSFQQVDTKRNRNVEGTGLGLAICKNLAYAMDGKLWLESEYGKGSVFYVTLPQMVVDETPSIDTSIVKHTYVMSFFRNFYMSGQMREDCERLKVPYFQFFNIKELERFESAIKEKCGENIDVSKEEIYLFLDKSSLTPRCEEFLNSHPCIKPVMVVDFNASMESSENFMVVRKPLSSMTISRIIHHEDIEVTDTVEDDDSVFFAPDANILIVDDNAINLTVAEGLLEPLKMRIDTAQSAKEALNRLESHEKKYDIIFMDHMMPEVDGVEATRLIRRFHPDYDDVPIIALTANAVEGARNLFLSEGMNDFVAKPIEVRIITQKVKQYLPPEKILKTYNKADEEVRNKGVPDLPKIEGLDIENAVKRLGGMKLFDSVIKEYYRTIEKKHKKINELFDAEDWKNYTVEVHALKSSSRQIGDDHLADAAAGLEKAGHENDIDYIKAHNAETMEEFIALKDKLSSYCKEEEEEKGSDEGKECIDSDARIEAFAKLREALENLDMDAMEGILDELHSYKLEGENEVKYKELKEAVADIDFEKCESIIDEWAKL